MGLMDSLKAILTRIIFGCHGLLAVYRVVALKADPYYWSVPGIAGDI